jgi:hypothetical protein
MGWYRTDRRAFLQRKRTYRGSIHKPDPGHLKPPGGYFQNLWNQLDLLPHRDQLLEVLRLRNVVQLFLLALGFLFQFHRGHYQFGMQYLPAWRFAG